MGENSQRAMSRIRTIKPEFWTSEQVVDCSPTARLLFIGMWNFCDDQGIHPASTKRLKMEIFPADSFTLDDIATWVDELLRHGLIRQYTVMQDEKAHAYWQVTGWFHQKIEKPHKRYPALPVNAQFDDPSTISRRTVDDPSTTNQRAVDDHSPPEGKGREGSINLLTEDMSGSSPDPGPPAKKSTPEKPKPPNGHHYLKDAEDVLKYLNDATERNFQLRNPNGKLTSNADLVVNRLKEGYTRLQLCEVVFYKAREWGGDDKMNQYLRPDTLFAKRNFEKYLGAIPPEPAA
jgi:uncharacterized phage protein (TIGR02220 family)